MCACRGSCLLFLRVSIMRLSPSFPESFTYHAFFLAVYGVGNEFDGSLVKDIQTTLRTLAGISTELHALLDTYFSGSIQKASRTVLRLLLSYHHVSMLVSLPTRCAGYKLAITMLTRHRGAVCCPHDKTARHVCAPPASRAADFKQVSNARFASSGIIHSSVLC